MSTEEKLEEINGLEKGERIVDICCNVTHSRAAWLQQLLLDFP
jgi:hypothetical protein